MHETVILTSEPLTDTEVLSIERVLKMGALDRKGFIHSVVRTERVHEGIVLGPSTMMRLYPKPEVEE